MYKYIFDYIIFFKYNSFEKKFDKSKAANFSIVLFFILFFPLLFSIEN